MRTAVEAVGTATNEKKAATMIGLVQQAIVEVANGKQPEVAARQAEVQAEVEAPPTQKLAVKRGTPADRCRRAYRKGTSWQQLKLAAQVSDSTAKRYAKQFAEEAISA